MKGVFYLFQGVIADGCYNEYGQEDKESGNRFPLMSEPLLHSPEGGNHRFGPLTDLIWSARLLSDSHKCVRVWEKFRIDMISMMSVTMIGGVWRMDRVTLYTERVVMWFVSERWCDCVSLHRTLQKSVESQNHCRSQHSSSLFKGSLHTHTHTYVQAGIRQVPELASMVF